MRLGPSVFLISLPAVCAAGCSLEPFQNEPEVDDEDLVIAWERREGHTLPTCEETEWTDSSPHEELGSTLRQTLVPNQGRVEDDNEDLDPSTEEGEAAYLQLGFGTFHEGPGLPHSRTFAAGFPGSIGDFWGPEERISLSWFVVLSDFQLVDDESPLQIQAEEHTGNFGNLRPHRAYIAHGMSAMNRTLEELESETREFDFGVITGDCTDSAQRNELRWAIDILDGKEGVHLDSGDDDDPVPGPENDPKDPFDPHGFPAPWFFVPGNHDTTVVGSKKITDDIRDYAQGDESVYGAADYTQWFAPIITGPVVPDDERLPLRPDEVVEELQNTEADPGPVGHGYAEGTRNGSHLDYVYDVVPGLLRLIAIDSSDHEGGIDGLIKKSTVEDWLIPELERAREEGLLVFLASHHPTDKIDRLLGGSDETDEDAIDPGELEEIVGSYPEVIVWLVGHSHEHRVRLVGDSDNSFFEIMTSALADYPNQTRVFEIVLNPDDTLSLLTSAVDFRATNCLERRFRRLALIDYQSAWSGYVPEEPWQQNVELVVPVPNSARDNIASFSQDAPGTIESLRLAGH